MITLVARLTIIYAQRPYHKTHGLQGAFVLLRH